MYSSSASSKALSCCSSAAATLRASSSASAKPCGSKARAATIVSALQFALEARTGLGAVPEGDAALKIAVAVGEFRHLCSAFVPKRPAPLGLAVATFTCGLADARRGPDFDRPVIDPGSPAALNDGRGLGVGRIGESWSGDGQQQQRWREPPQDGAGNGHGVAGCRQPRHARRSWQSYFAICAATVRMARATFSM